MLSTEATTDTPPPTNSKRYHFERDTMKPKRKRVGSLPCFSAPVTADESETIEIEKRRRSDPVKDPIIIDKEEGIRRKKGHHFRVLSKILRLISIRSNSSRVKSRKDHKRSLSRKISNSSDAQTANESNLHSSLFSSSLSSSCSSSSSSSFSSSSLSASASSRMSSSVAASASEFAQKVKGRRTFMPPPVFKNIGYARGLCLVLLSLFVMVFCGRLFAILFTATWLCLVPRRRVGGKVDDMAAAEGRRKAGEKREVEKRRVVLEGFLQRNRKDI